jgi:hypothetical protein
VTREIHVVVGLNTPEADAAALDACDRECGKSGKMNAMPGPLRIRGSVVIPEVELRWRFSRSSGPGGQSVNTTDRSRNRCLSCRTR